MVDPSLPTEAQRQHSPDDVPELVPVRMLNEFTYCPRLMYLEWVQGDFTDNADTIEGRFRHARVDKPSGDLDLTKEARVHARSVELSAPRLGLIAKLDLVEAEGKAATPVDYKRGTPPDIPERVWEPERVQLCAQGLILEENGYTCTSGVVYFVESKQRVPVLFDEALRTRTLELLAECRRAAAAESLPQPLKDSPKCPRCSLVGICLPDEINLLQSTEHDAEAEPRRLLPARDDALPLYVQSAGARVGKDGDELVVTTRDGDKHQVRIAHTSQVGLFGRVQISTQAIQDLCRREIPIVYFSHGGWLYGITTGMTHKNVQLRCLQFAAAQDEGRALSLARRLVSAKIRNCRTLLRRNGDEVPGGELEMLKALAAAAEGADNAASLLGIEGTAARVYFGSFAKMLRPPSDGARWEFDFTCRNRRPPRDAVNAMLSLAYALLTKDLAATLVAVGFDPFLGFYHRPRYGRPALALDLIEEFRPLIADSVVLGAINTGVVRPGDIIRRGAGVALTDNGRARFIDAYERRMDELVTHPVFGYRISYRRVLEVQARLLARHLAGEIDAFPAFCTR